MRRQAIPDSQKKALREWYYNKYPRPRQRDCVPWFKEHFDHQLSVSSVCEILSKRYDFLDRMAAASPSLSSSKHRSSNWPVLEETLYDWQQQVERDGARVPGDVLIEKARTLWPEIPQYRDQPVPEFSTGWLAGFRKRHESRPAAANTGIQPVPVPASAEGIVKSVQTLSGEYPEENVYSMGEYGLYWRQSVLDDRSPLLSVRKGQSRIVIVACTNCTGSDRLPLRIIGQYAQGETPRSLRGINVRALGGVWRSEKAARMTSPVMREWLASFYSHVGTTRPILLLMEDFHAHVEGVNLAPPPTNIRIQWLPVNASGALYQPLAQGIIGGLKTFYRKKLLQFMVGQYERSDLDPVDTVSLYHAVHWILQVWKYDLTSSAIYSSFRKTVVINPQIPSLPHEPDMPDLSALYYQVQQVGQLRDAKLLSEFLEPKNEDVQVVDNTQNDDISYLVSMPLDTGMARTERVNAITNMEDGQTIVQPPSVKQALECVSGLLSYQEFQDDVLPSDIQYLERLQRRLAYSQYASN